ncbi:MAG: nickel pincer cofactor biosynthesis protein LarB [Nitrospirae bacterium]|nr:nickel pincer cofactor biosynthesis protein LarB [Nitrospirota bacterium]MCL5978467.1 nickel pincer cofactor biosynthesis protein LarB [Nitrospirota bacterium]
MDTKKLESLLGNVKNGNMSPQDAMEAIKHLPFEDMGFAKVDHHRGLRNGIPEVIFAQNKKTEDIVSIANAMLRRSGRFLITKASEYVYKALTEARGDRQEAIDSKKIKFYPEAGVISYGEKQNKKGSILIISAGTSDLPVAEEAEATASFLGSKTERLYDVGVAGIHRLLSHRKLIGKTKVIIVVAGMEGALPSVVGGITDRPVIAVPTSVGYGTSLGGLTALFAMLNSCVPGIAVMNIDNGFGAGCLAHKINTIKTG